MLPTKSLARTPMSLPKTTKALVLRKSEKKPTYHDVALEERPIPDLEPGQVLVQIKAVSFNRRDLWIRMGQYPGIGFNSVLGADGVGIVIHSSESSDPLLNQRVFLTPGRGWESHPDAPEDPKYGVLGGSKDPLLGTFAEYVVVDRNEVIRAPEHVDDIHLSAWPLGGVTSWRAAVVNGKVEAGQNVLITGIGGGVALVAMQICLAKGANVYVTSGNKDKIDKAVALGAKAGVNYKDKEWPKQLASILQKNKTSSNTDTLALVIDSGGGDILQQVGTVLRRGGKLVCYGLTANPSITFTMREVMRNQQLIGSTMGSRQDLINATAFLSEHKIIPVVSNILAGLESAEQGFVLLKDGTQFGKVVIDLSGTKAKF